MDTSPSSACPGLLSLARPLFETPPPAVSPDDAVRIARDVYGMEVSVKLLSGERDTNYRLTASDGSRWVLKLINPIEPDEDADMQVRVLDHLAPQALELALPLPRLTRDGAAIFRLTLPSGEPVRGRCYSYVEGEPALLHPVTDRLRCSVGRTVALVGKGLQGFQHPAMGRLNLWDLCKIGHLDELMAHQHDPQIIAMLSAVMERFRTVVHPRLPSLRQQVIHNDLSRTNTVVLPTDPEQICGVLDFGDMIHGPLLSELAVAASYQLELEDPLRALKIVVAGFVEVTPLLPEECALLMDFLLARLVGRILISQWRAEQFPDNKDYILRSNTEAQALLTRLFPLWQQTPEEAWQGLLLSDI